MDKATRSNDLLGASVVSDLAQALKGDEAFRAWAKEQQQTNELLRRAVYATLVTTPWEELGPADEEGAVRASLAEIDRLAGIPGFGRAMSKAGLPGAALAGMARRKRQRRKTSPTPAIPKELDTPEFRRAWGRWERHRAEMKKPLSDSTREAQLRKLSYFDPEAATAAVETSIEMGWMGLFPKGPGGQPKAADGQAQGEVLDRQRKNVEEMRKIRAEQARRKAEWEASRGDAQRAGGAEA